MHSGKLAKKVQSYTVYMVQCSDASFYTGITTDVDRRLKQHNGEVLGGAVYTRSRQPVHLVYRELCVSKGEALRKELQIKKMTHAEKQLLITERR